MALRIDSIKHRLYIILLVIMALAFFTGAAVLAYDAILNKGTLTAPSNYTYTVSQSINSDVEYVENSFYPDGPEGDNTAYVTELTDTILSKFHYSYNGSDAQRLQYTYTATATVGGTYGVPGGNEDISNVWSRHFVLEEPVTKTVDDSEFSIDSEVEIPFSDYLKLVEDFRLGLALPVGSEIEVKFQVKVSGTINGESFSDTRTSTISTPLNVQIYQLATQYDKTDTKEVTAPPGSSESRWRTQTQLTVSVVLGIAGISCAVFALRRRRNQSAYQRLLEKIYRYHDGIIIRTSKPAKLSQNKSIVPVASFEDILNLEEETKSPIIASPAGETATKFMIVEGDVVYMYTLGDEPIAAIQEDDLESIEATLQKPKAVTKPKRKTARKIHQ